MDSSRALPRALPRPRPRRATRLRQGNGGQAAAGPWAGIRPRLWRFRLRSEATADKPGSGEIVDRPMNSLTPHVREA